MPHIYFSYKFVRAFDQGLCLLLWVHIIPADAGRLCFCSFLPLFYFLEVCFLSITKTPLSCCTICQGTRARHGLFNEWCVVNPDMNSVHNEILPLEVIRHLSHTPLDVPNRQNYQRNSKLTIFWTKKLNSPSVMCMN